MDHKLIGFYNAMRRQYNKISDETRQNVVKTLDEGRLTRDDVARLFNLPYKTVCSIYKRFNEDGILHALPRGGHKQKILTDDDVNAIRDWIDDNPLITLKDLRDKLAAERDVHVCLETVRKSVGEFEYSIKRVSLRAEAAETEELWQQRRQYCEWFLAANWQEGRMIFLDDTGFKYSTRRSRGWSPKGTPAKVVVPALRSRNVTAIAAIRANGLAYYKVLDGNGNRAAFLQFLQELFEHVPPNCILVMDNASIPKGIEVEQLIAQRGHSLRYLPSYSSFFNPMEAFFAQWKGYVKQTRPTNEAELRAAINTVHQRVTPEHCLNYFQYADRNCIRCLEGGRDMV